MFGVRVLRLRGGSCAPGPRRKSRGTPGSHPSRLLFVRGRFPQVKGRSPALLFPVLSRIVLSSWSHHHDHRRRIESSTCLSQASSSTACSCSACSTTTRRCRRSAARRARSRRSGHRETAPRVHAPFSLPVSVNKSTPLERRVRENTSFQSTTSGAGLQFMLCDCRARACAKGISLFHRHRYYPFGEAFPRCVLVAFHQTCSLTASPSAFATACQGNGSGHVCLDPSKVLFSERQDVQYTQAASQDFGLLRPSP